MAKPRLHLDADVSYRVLQRVLLERGHDVTRTLCEWMPLDALLTAVAAVFVDEKGGDKSRKHF